MDLSEYRSFPPLPQSTQGLCTILLGSTMLLSLLMSKEHCCLRDPLQEKRTNYTSGDRADSVRKRRAEHGHVVGNPPQEELEQLGQALVLPGAARNF